MKIFNRYTDQLILEVETLWGADLREANLSEADLREANLQGVDLQEACLSGVNLREVCLLGANLQGANLWGANLRGANLREACLLGANLREADLWEADLWGANLQGANLQGANLQEANLSGANFQGANLWGTILDPEAPIPPCDCSSWELRPDGRLRGWRTLRSTHCGETLYTPGWHTAPVFSVDSTTECHPGLYVLPTRKAALEWLEEYGGEAVIEVAIEPETLLKAGSKWRCVRFEVVSNKIEPEGE